MSCPRALILLPSLLYQVHSQLTQGIESRSLLWCDSCISMVMTYSSTRSVRTSIRTSSPAGPISDPARRDGRVAVTHHDALGRVEEAPGGVEGGAHLGGQ